MEIKIRKPLRISQIAARVIRITITAIIIAVDNANLIGLIFEYPDFTIFC